MVAMLQTSRSKKRRNIVLPLQQKYEAFLNHGSRMTSYQMLQAVESKHRCHDNRQP